MATKTDSNGNIVTFELDTKNTYVGETMAFNINVTTSGIDTSDATASAEDIKVGKTAYVNGSLVTGTHEEETFTTQEKTISPTEDIQTIAPDVGYDGLSKVIVTAIANDYVGSSITVNPDIQVSQATVTIPKGYYNADQTETVAVGALGTVSATKSAVNDHTVTITPAISGGTAGYISDTDKTGTAVSITASDLVSGELAITPTESAQTLDVTNYASASVEAISSTYVGSEVPTIAATTYTPGTSDQTIAANSYLTGAQTIKGDANLLTENIAKDVTIFGITGSHEGGVDTSDATAETGDIALDKTAYVNGNKITGTLVFQNFYTGAAAPEADLGADGDFYFKTTETTVADVVGAISSTDNSISLTDTSLASDTYTLYYENASGNKLDGWSAIGTITN